jgi:hypothetical protein
MLLTEMTDPGPPITDVDLDALDHAIGAKLPASYRRFLLEHNGGQPTPDSFPFRGKSRGSMLDVFFGIGHPNGMFDLSRSYAGWSGRVPKDLIPDQRESERIAPRSTMTAPRTGRSRRDRDPRS